MAGKRNIGRLRKAVRKENTAEAIKNAGQAAVRAGKSAVVANTVKQGSSAVRQVAQNEGKKYAGTGRSGKQSIPEDSANRVRNPRLDALLEKYEKTKKDQGFLSAMEKYRNKDFLFMRNGENGSERNKPISIAEIRETTKKMREEMAKAQTSTDSEEGRLRNLTEGNLRQIAGSHVKTLGAIVEGSETNIVPASAGSIASPLVGLKYSQVEESRKNAQKESGKAMSEFGSSQIDKGAEKIKKGKEGLNWAEAFLADLYGEALGLGADALAGPLSGAAMFSRSFGSAYDRAEKEGATPLQAGIYGISMGGVDAGLGKLTKVAKPLRKLYGKDAGDDVIDTLLNKVSGKMVSQKGKDIVWHGGKAGVSALTEALEEMVAEGLEPSIANQIYAEAAGIPHETSAKDILYAGLLGSALGGSHSGVTQAWGYSQGRKVRDVFGEEGTKELAKKAAAADEDSGTGLVATAMEKMIETGQGIAAGQAKELYKAAYQQEVKDLERAELARRSSERIIRGENLVPPTITDRETGKEILNVNTARLFDEKKMQAAEAVKAMQLPGAKAGQIVESVARIETGVAGVDDVNLFTVPNQEAREAYTAVTGKTLPGTNKGTREALYETIAVNRVNSARMETENHIDRMRGVIEQNMTQDYESAGQETFAQVFGKVDVRDVPQVEDAAVTFDGFYRAGRNGIDYVDVASIENPAYQNVSPGVKQAAWDAGRQDAFIASDTAKGLQLKLGQSLRENRVQTGTQGTQGRVTAELPPEGKALLKASDQGMFRALARTFGLDIHIVEEEGVDGVYRDGEAWLSVDADRGLSSVLAHEITRQMEVYAPEEYDKLKDLVQADWAKRDDMDETAGEKKSQYAESGVEQPHKGDFDDIIANSVYEMIQDKAFANEMCRHHRDIAQPVLDAVKAVQKKLRIVLAEGERFTQKQNAALFSNLDILKDSESIWADGLMRTAQNWDAAGQAGVFGNVKRYPANMSKDSPIKRQIQENLEKINAIGVVADIKSDRFKGMTDEQIIDEVMPEFRKRGAGVDRTGLGFISLKETFVNNSLNYLGGEAEYAAFAAIPNVLKKGMEIRDAGYEASGHNAALAAPVVIDGKTGIIGAAVKETKENEYKVHRILMPDGTEYVFHDSIFDPDGNDREQFSLPAPDAVNDYINAHETEFVEAPPVRDYEREGAELREQSIGELQEQVKKLRQGKRLTHGKVFDKASVEEELNSLVRTLMSHSEGTANKTDHRLVKMLAENASSVYTAMKDGDIAGAANTAWYAARDAVENLRLVDDWAFREYKELRDVMRTTAVTVSEAGRGDIPDFADFRRKNMGRLRLVDRGGIPVDTLYMELCEAYPELFSKDVTHSASQLVAMADIRAQLEPYDIMLSAEETGQLVKEAAHDLLDIAARGKPWKSWADRKTECYDGKLKAMKVRQAEALRNVKIRERMGAVRMVDRQNLKHRECKQKDRKEHIRQFGSIQENYEWLSGRLLNPADDKHIPEGFRTTVARLLQQTGLRTEWSKSLEKKYGKAQKTLQMGELKRQFAEIAKEDGSGIFEYDRQIFELMDVLSEKLEGKPIEQATNEELASIDTLLKAIASNVRNYNRAFTDGIKEEISGLAGRSIDAAKKHIEKHGNRSERSGAMGGMDIFPNESMVTPRDFFEQIGGMEEIFLAMRKGMDKHVDNLTKARGFFDEIFTPYHKGTALRKQAKPGSRIEGWRDGSQMHRIELASGRSISLSPAQVMSFYCLSKREQAQGHILGSGVVASRVDNASKLKQFFGAKVQTAGSAVMVSPADVEKIIALLTPEQRQMADRLQGYLDSECAGWGNEASMRLYGYRKFTEKDCFPLKSADQYLDSSFEGRRAAERIKDFGFTKGTAVNANNPVVIDDIFCVVSDHINKMSLYNAFAAPISDFTRVYNHKTRDGEGHMTGSVKSSIEDAYGRKAVSYIDNFLADVNGIAQMRTEDMMRFASKPLANNKKATIGGNIWAASQQPAAIMRAFMLISPRYFANGKINTAKNLQDMKAHCQIARWKSWGHNQADMARDIGDIMMNNAWMRLDALAMELYGKLDDLTWPAIWAAVRSETEAKHPDVAVDSEEFYAICNDRASEIFDKTQAVDSVFHRSQAMRNTDTMNGAMASFMAEPMRTFNMVRMEFVQARELWKDGEAGKAAQKASRAMTVFTMNVALCAVAAAIVDALRSRTAGDDGKEDGCLENFIENFEDSMNPLNMIPLAEKFSGVTGGWDSQNMELEGYASLVQSAIGLVKADDPAKAFRELAESMGLVFGIPVKNVLRDAKAVFNAFGINAFAAEAGCGETLSREKEPLMDKWAALFGGKASGRDGETGGENRDESDSEYYGIYAGSKESLWDKITDKTYSERKQEDREKRVSDIEKNVKGLSGGERDEAIWKAVTKNYIRYVEDGEMDVLREMRWTLDRLGGNVDKFDESILSKVKTAYKKNIGGDLGMLAMYAEYLLGQGFTEEKISSGIIANSETAKKFQKQVCLNDCNAAADALADLISAGIMENDIYALYDNRAKAIDASDYSSGTFLAPVSGRISSGYGYRDAPSARASSLRQAIDIAAPAGADVVAADGGQVTKAGWSSGYGWTVEILHGNGRYTKYSHLQGYAVQKGDVVRRGQLIGYVGSTGVSMEPHLDFKVKEGGQWVNPMDYLQ